MDAAGSIPGESSIGKGRLTAAFVRSVVRPGVYGDEHGLRLRVCKSRKRKSISKRWIWRGTVNGVRRDAGRGGFPYFTLAEARQAAYRRTDLFERRIFRLYADGVSTREIAFAPNRMHTPGQRVQKRRQAGEDRRKNPVPNSRLPLTGLVRCAQCGGNMTIVRNRRYACNAHREKGTAIAVRRPGAARHRSPGSIWSGSRITGWCASPAAGGSAKSVPAEPSMRRLEAVATVPRHSFGDRRLAFAGSDRRASS